jgi:hypothetical protein
MPTGDNLAVSEEPVYDSCMDDLNSILAATPEPDPFLDDRQPTVPDAAGVSAVPAIKDDQEEARKRTSEVFRAMLSQPASAYSDSWVAQPATSVEPEERPEDRVLSATSAHPSTTPHEEPDSTDDLDPDDSGSMRSAWVQLVLASYASAVTLALVWVLWSGRSIQTPEADAADDSSQATVPLPEPRPLRRTVAPPLPSANTTSIGKPIRLGDLDVTPVGISSGLVRLIRTIHPDEVREPKEPSLILRLQFKNLAHDHPFAPLDREFVREPSARIDDSYIEAPDGTRIPLFPLAADSEWSIAGQDFSPIAPGQAMETTLVSAAIDPAALADRLTWRVRLRTGLYSTTVLGVTFTKSQITKNPGELH